MGGCVFGVLVGLEVLLGLGFGYKPIGKGEDS